MVEWKGLQLEIECDVLQRVEKKKISKWTTTGVLSFASYM